MESKVRRVSTAIVVAGVAAALLTVLAVPAGARVAEKNEKFCEILYGGDQGAGLDFDGLSPAEAELAAKLFRSLANTGVPAKLKKDLKKLAKVDQRIADGEPANVVLADEQESIGKALARLTKYVGANCSPAVPST